jgi:hypothetical protein
LSNKQLKFIHIPKTGGSAIEKMGMSKGYRWGQFHGEYNKIVKWELHHPCHRFISIYDESFIKKYDWFIIMRNPIDIIVSAVHSPWAHGPGPKILQSFTVHDFNEYIKYRILSRDLYSGDSFSPQHLYFTDKSKLTVLKYERLEEDFNKLMIEYNLPVRYINKFVNKSPKKFSKDDINKENKQLIKQAYQKDIEIWQNL